MTYSQSYNLFSRHKNKLCGNSQLISNVCEDFVSGKTIQEITLSNGVSRQTAYAWLTVFYFPYKGDNAVTLVIRSSV